MNNFNTITLKQLYGLNITTFNALRAQLNQERLENYTKGSIVEYLVFNKNNINQLIQQQSSIKNKIPYEKLNIVNNFLIDITGDIHSFENKINLNKQQNNSNSTNSKFNFNTNNLLNFNIDPSIKQNTQNTQKIDLDNIDPYELYGIDRNKPISLDELKTKYRTYALQTHPDKNNGETKNFIIVKECFRVIFEDYKLKKNDKQYNELKNDSLGYLEKQQKQNFNNKKIDKNSFNIHKFNKVYNDNKIENVNDNGYDNWRDDNKFDSDDIQKDANLTMNNFHDRFNSNVKISKDIIHYEKPRELFMNADNNCEELGKNSIDNYSGKTKNISYTDYKEAHTTTKLVDTNIDFKTYKNVDELKHSRENIKELTSEEIMNIELEKNRKEQLEQDRIGHMRHMDGMYSKQYDRIHNIMLK